MKKDLLKKGIVAALTLCVSMSMGTGAAFAENEIQAQPEGTAKTVERTYPVIGDPLGEDIPDSTINKDGEDEWKKEEQKKAPKLEGKIYKQTGRYMQPNGSSSVLSNSFRPEVRFSEKDGNTTYEIAFKEASMSGKTELVQKIKVDGEEVSAVEGEGEYKAVFTFTKKGVKAKEIPIALYINAMKKWVDGKIVLSTENKKPKKPKMVTQVTKSGVTYKIDNLKKKTATVVNGKKNLLKVKILNTVKIGKVNCRVVAVSGKAFQNQKKLKEVTLDKNMSYIGKDAFRNAKNLKKIIFKGKFLKKVNSGAFKGTFKKPQVRIPKKVVKKYKKMLIKAGMSRKLVIKRA